MKIVRVVGRKNHGKTTLVLELIAELSRRGFKVGAIKHSSHDHEVDASGKDSQRQRQAGASPAAILTQSMCGVFFEMEKGKDPYPTLLPFYAHCDYLIIEGHIDYPGPKIEVWREEKSTECLAFEGRGIIAVVSDDEGPFSVPRWPRSNVSLLVDKIIAETRWPCQS